ncbi:hypothetical protein PAMA_022010 [Pampus argenteus]
MSHSQFHCTGRVYLDLHGLIFETSICYWQDQPGSPQPKTLSLSPVNGRNLGGEREENERESFVSLNGHSPPPSQGTGDGPKLFRLLPLLSSSFWMAEKPRVHRNARRGRARSLGGGGLCRDGLRGRTAGADGASRSR